MLEYSFLMHALPSLSCPIRLLDVKGRGTLLIHFLSMHMRGNEKFSYTCIDPYIAYYICMEMVTYFMHATPICLLE